MNFSVSDAARKWHCQAKRCGKVAFVALGLLAVMAEWSPSPARQPRSPFADFEAALFGRPRTTRRAKALTPIAVPVPQPRPPAAPSRIVEPIAPIAADVLPKPRPDAAPPPAGEKLDEKPAEKTPAVEAPAAPPPPSACRLALTDEVAIAPSIPDIVGPGECGGVDLVRLEAVVLRDATRVPLKPAATLRCEMAAAVASWMRDDIAALAASLGTAPAALDNFDSFDCRGRNRVVGAKVSEHGHANALDIRGIALKNGVALALTDRATARESREKVLQSVCARFSTVLGPGSDGYHEDHIHLDLAARRSGYRICQWAIYDPMPAIAPLMPASRPAEAPPRAIVDKKADGKADGKAAVPPAAEPNAEEDADPEPTTPPKSVRQRGEGRVKAVR